MLPRVVPYLVYFIGRHFQTVPLPVHGQRSGYDHIWSGPLRRG